MPNEPITRALTVAFCSLREALVRTQNEGIPQGSESEPARRTTNKDSLQSDGQSIELTRVGTGYQVTERELLKHGGRNVRESDGALGP